MEIQNFPLIVLFSIITAALVLIGGIIFFELGKRESRKASLLKQDSADINNGNKSSIQKNDLDPVTNSNSENKRLNLNNPEFKEKGNSIHGTNFNKNYDKKDTDEKKRSNSKYLKYTSNGYIQAKGDKETAVFIWR